MTTVRCISRPSITFVGDFVSPAWQPARLTGFLAEVPDGFLALNLEGAILNHYAGSRPRSRVKHNIASDRGCLEVLPVDRTIFCVANNHFEDFEAHDRLDRHSYSPAFEVGSIRTPELEIQVGGRRLVLVVFSLPAPDPLRWRMSTYSNMLSPAAALRRLEETRRRHPDATVVAYIHWGYEFQEIPFPADRAWARCAIEAGTDVIIGNHPHVCQPIEFISGKPVIFSLGNFYFPSGSYFGKECEFPEVSSESAALNFDGQNFEAWTLRSDYARQDVRVLSRSPAACSPLKAEFSGISDAQYARYFREHKKRGRAPMPIGVPLLDDYESLGGFSGRAFLLWQDTRQFLRNSAYSLRGASMSSDSRDAPADVGCALGAETEVETGGTHAAVRPMRVLISHQGCIPIYRRGLFERLARMKGIEYVVAYGKPPRGTAHILAPDPHRFSTLRIDNRELPIGGGSIIWQPLVRYFWEDFDAAVLGDEVKYISHLAIIAAAKLRRRPVLLWGFGDPAIGERDLDGSGLTRRIIARCKTIYRKMMLKIVDGYLVYTEGGAARLAAAGVPAHRVATIYNTVDVDEQMRLRVLALESSDADCRRILRVPLNGPVLLYFGRFRTGKSLEVLIDYARRAETSGRALSVVLFGAGPDRQELEARAAGLGNVVFHEANDGLTLAQALRVATAVVIPGYVGLAITHGFAHGVPMVTRDNIVHAPEIEYLAPGENGLLLPHNTEEFFEGLDRFLDDPQLQARLRQGASESATRLSMDKMAVAFDGLVRRLLEQSAAGVAFAFGSPGTPASSRAFDAPGKAELGQAKGLGQTAAVSPDVSVCICTYNRPHVRETINSVLRQEGLAKRSMEIVVADDDPSGSAQSIVAEAAAGSAIPIRYVRSGASNVAAARNVCLDTAQGTWVAFIDDDEVAEPTWLADLLEAQQKYAADVVKGYVRAVYPSGAPGWVRFADPYTRDYGATGECPKLLATGNVLVRRALVEQHHLRFDPAFGRSGGEDTEFFHRMCANSPKVIASRDAVVNEIVPDYRITLHYLASRYKRMGQTQGKKARLGLSDQSTVSAVTMAVPAVVLLWTYPLFRIIGARLGFKVFAKFWYSIGILDGAVRLRADDMT